MYKDLKLCLAFEVCAMRKIHVLFAALAIFSFGCSNGIGPDNNQFDPDPNDAAARITGSLSSGIFSPAASRAVTEVNVDKILAVEVTQIVGISNIANAVEAVINEDRTFSLEISEHSQNLVLLLVDTSRERHSQIVGYVSIADIDETLILFPVENQEGDLDLGTVELEGDEGVSETILSETQTIFNITIEALQEIARSDNMLKLVKNLYMNWDGQDTYWEPFVQYQWVAQSMDTASVTNTRNSPEDYTYYGYRMDFSANKQSYFTMDEICSVSKTLQLIPPADITDGTRTWGPTAPFSNDTFGSEPIEYRTDGTRFGGDDDWGVRDQHPELELDEVLDIGMHVDLVGQVPHGFWRMNLDGEDIAFFDLGVSDPFSAAGNPINIVPVLYFDCEPDRLINSIKFFRYQYNNSTGTYEDVGDSLVVRDSMGWCGFDFDDNEDNENRGFSRIEFQDYDVSATEIDGDWYLLDGEENPGILDIDKISLTYRNFNVQFYFEFYFN